jgi:hypothetical protein
MITLEDTYNDALHITHFKNINELIDYINDNPSVNDRVLKGDADFYFSTQEERYDMNIENFVICDWETRGNVVRLYCCDQDKYNDIWGDDWDDQPYEHNAGRVYDKYVDKVIDIYFDFDAVILEAENDYSYNGCSPFSKQDFKEGKAPIFIAYWPQENDYWDGSEYHLLIGGKNNNHILKFYMGDMIKPTLTDNKKIVHYIVHE